MRSLNFFFLFPRIDYRFLSLFLYFSFLWVINCVLTVLVEKIIKYTASLTKRQTNNSFFLWKMIKLLWFYNSRKRKNIWFCCEKGLMPVTPEARIHTFDNMCPLKSLLGHLCAIYFCDVAYFYALDLMLH